MAINPFSPLYNVFALKLLGGAVLEGRDGPVTGRAAHKRRLAILAVLAVARGRPVGRERIIGLLWPEHPTDSARHLLSESLYVLRKELGEGAVVGVGDDVALDPAVVPSDVGELEATLEAGDPEGAARVYAGPFLDGFYVADAPEFERWAEGERERLARIWARAVESLAEAREAAGCPLQAADWWRTLAARDPHSSRIALRLMRALDAAGERAAALRAGSTHAALMREDLEVEPDPEVLAYAERLRAEPPRSARAAPVPLPEPGAVTAPDEVQPEPGDAAGAPGVGPAEGAPPVRTGHLPRVPVRGARQEPRWNRAAYHGGLVGMILGLLLAALTSPRPPAANPSPERDPRRIAVLYPDDYTPGRALQYLGNGLVERVTHDLSQVDGLEITPLNAVKAYRDGKMSYDSLISSLDVGSVVEVSVQGAGERVRVTVKLADTNTRKYLDSQTIDHELGDLLSLQDSVSGTVVQALRRVLGREIRVRERRAGTQSDEALALVLHGEKERDDAAVIARRKHPLDAAAAARRLRIADSLLARAEAADPEWPDPPILRGRVALSLAMLLDEGPARTQALAIGLGHAKRALDKEPDNPAALEVHGTLLWQLVATAATTPAKDPRLAAAERDLRRAIDLEPSRATAMATLSQLLRIRGGFAEADLFAQKAVEADAFLEDAHVILNQLHFSSITMANYAAATEWCERGRRQFPEHRYFVDCRLRLLVEDPSVRPDPNLAWRLVAEGNRVDPPETARAAGHAYQPIYRQMAAAAVLARAGQKDSARAVVARARQATDVDGEMRVDVMYDEANVRLLLGEKESALRLLEGYLALRPDQKPFIARDPLFSGLAQEPRFRRIVSP